MGVPANGQVAIAVAQRGVLQNPGGATGNLGGAAAAGVARRGRDGFRKEVKRQIQAGQDLTGQLQGQAGQIQTDQTQAGQTQADQTQAGQTQAGQVQGQAGQVQGQAGQTQVGQGQAQAGQIQAGTPTTNNNPVASQLLLAPTFTPIQANAILDQTNMRIAIPVRQVDGEFILTMQKMNVVQAIQPAPAAGQAPPPTAEPAKISNGTAPATPQAGKAPERRQDSSKDKYGNEKPPPGAIIMTMKMIDDMVASVTWGGQAGITQMMSEYVKGQTGNDLVSITTQ
jgi:hypothetical protein